MNAIEVRRPGPDEYAPPFERYVSRITETDIMDALRRQRDELPSALGAVRGAAERHRYAEGKWSVCEVVGHLIDAERVFGYRAVCLARGEKGPLPSFDENDYAAHATFDQFPLEELLQEFTHVRDGHLAFFRHLDAQAWVRAGTVGGHPTSVRGLAYIIVGHVRHHLAVLQDRYLPSLPA
jgi:hypothetical protein